MRKKIKISLMLMLTALPLAAAQAAGLENPLPGSSGSIEDIANKVILALLGFSGVLALVTFIYGGFMWMTAMGDSGKVEKAKGMMVWSVLGLMIIMGSYAILTLVFKALGIGGR